ncbi:MAG TPA: hypothetical protein VJB70_04845 [Candidatus Paceibacterota bacterium]
MKNCNIGLIWIGWGLGTAGTAFANLGAAIVIGVVGAVCAMLASIFASA